VQRHTCATRIILFSFLLAVAPTFSHSAPTNEDQQDPFDLPKLVALQNRAYLVNRALNFQLGYLPSDAFNKGVIIGASYAYYFTDFAAWEIVNANYSFNMPTDIKRDLESLNVGVSGRNAPYLDYVNWYATTGLVYTPLYNKSLLFNKSVVYGETSFVVAAGPAKFEFAGIRPIVGGGLILQFFLDKTSSLKFDFRNYVYFNQTGAQSFLHLAVGYSMQLGDAPKSKSSDPLGAENESP
jgi:outer membrane beta-barrel protein